jgi:2-keto-4-pentenoate hydratase
MADVTTTIRNVGRILEACGQRLVGGDRILCGSVVHVPVHADDRLTARIAGLGEVTIRLEG